VFRRFQKRSKVPAQRGKELGEKPLEQAAASEMARIWPNRKHQSRYPSMTRKVAALSQRRELGWVGTSSSVRERRGGSFLFIATKRSVARIKDRGLLLVLQKGSLLPMVGPRPREVERILGQALLKQIHIKDNDNLRSSWEGIRNSYLEGTQRLNEGWAIVNLAEGDSCLKSSGSRRKRNRDRQRERKEPASPW